MSKEIINNSLCSDKENFEIIVEAVDRAVKEYRETLELLGTEEGKDEESF
ncbi:MAG: hypothetical protein AAB948_00635 [Patescibacteria group bacterium]